MAISGFAVMILTAFGCAETPPLPDGPIDVSLEDLWTSPNEYEGEYVVVTGQLRGRDYLFFESVVTTNNIKPVIYVRPDFRNADNRDASAATADCENQLVRAYGHFRKWSQYESLISGVYLIVKIKHRAPGPNDITCWSNPNADPWRGSHTVK